MAKEHMNAVPQKAIETAKAALRPTIYASRTPGSTSGGKTLRSSDAPVTNTWYGFTPGAVLGRVASRRLAKDDCPTDVLNAPPTVRKTVKNVS